MMTMSDDGDRTCPLCAEDMDVTDQQLKPCKCGYEICVWCWHHIMEMAEKEETEGRCPACRTPYDKERIVRMAANCERMVAEINAEKRQKAQKAKSKSSLEARKHLTSVRVIQRNLVYIIGLPSNLCDENILECREYFGQYGKVLKVSISRPTSGAAQQVSTNNTFSVYITYAREEEAIRCIQAVHNFVLEGKSLRACFGTTKYCHAWLRNMTCSNPDCLYLHDVGSQDDSFTKDEIISAYTRVPQLVFNTSQKRSGSILPAPADDFHNSGTVSSKNALKNCSNNASSQIKISPNIGTGKSTLPAAASWGLRGLNPRTAAASVTCSTNVLKQKVEAYNDPVSNSSINTSTKQTSAWYDDEATTQLTDSKLVRESGGVCQTLKSYRPGIGKDCRATTSSEPLPDVDISSVPSAWNDDTDVESKITEAGHMTRGTEMSMCLEPQISVHDVMHPLIKLNLSPKDVLDGHQPMQISCLSSSLTSLSEADKSDVPSEGSTILLKNPIPKDISKQLNNVTSEKVTESKVDHVNMPHLCIELSSALLDANHGAHNVKEDQQQDSICKVPSVEIPPSESSTLERCHSKKGEHLASSPFNKDYPCSKHIYSTERFDESSERQKQAAVPPANDRENNFMAADDRKLRFFGATDEKLSSFAADYRISDSTLASSGNDIGSKHSSFAADAITFDSAIDKRLFVYRGNTPALSNRHQEGSPSGICEPRRVFSHPGMNSLKDQAESDRKFDNIVNIDKAANVDREESSIISDILSLDFDPWDESTCSSNNFVKILGESEKHDGHFKISAPWNPKNSNESRFSFARQEYQVDTLEPSLSDSSHQQKFSLLSEDSRGGGYPNGFLFQTSEGLGAAAKTNPTYASDRPSGVARTKISAPPGFSMPSRIPPGFSSQGRSNQAYDVVYQENHLGNSLSENQYQGHLHGGSGDIEFIDPAILAVGKGRLAGVNDLGFDLKPLSSYPTQFNTSNGDPRTQLFMQHQNLKMSDHIGDAFTPVNDSYASSHFLAQNHSSLSPLTQMSLQQPRNSHFTNSHWNGWSDMRASGNIGVTEMLRNEYFGLGNLYSSNDENNFPISSSNGLYNRAFGM